MQAQDQLKFLRDGLAGLKDYLLSDELFWPMGGSQQLTPGNLLFAKAYLEGTGQSLANEAQQLAALKTEWRQAWQKKTAREFDSRLRQWEHVLSELADQPQRHADYYATEVRLRALLELLAETPEQRQQLAGPDALLRGLAVPGDFVWEPAAAAAFPAQAYWFLYRRPKPADQD